MRTFLDFIHTEKTNHPQFMMSIQKEDPSFLHDWFQTLGYEVSLMECMQVIETYKVFLENTNLL
ncbi:hypothetical protein [Leptospira sarikeiensis]|uniref:Uncharacterized protein n=1 Tax=Leptospira sarikeiensis TaxID=2484943 RepID=A0A4V3JRJ0_9LEPT|nr:hypothetical protein [Leptospira sarikeiensis]TGL60432.1 hypothetical protein EHQ64_11340 [Leptospira sarikeiensis]